MNILPAFNESGDLPPGVHRAPLDEIIAVFGTGSAQRRIVAQRLQHIRDEALHTGHVARFVLFGSFITAHPDPNDVDVFLVMDDAFNVEEIEGEAAILFNHMLAQAWFGASVFWIRQSAAFGGEEAMIEHWQIKRDGSLRGIVEVVADD